MSDVDATMMLLTVQKQSDMCQCCNSILCTYINLTVMSTGSTVNSHHCFTDFYSIVTGLSVCCYSDVRSHRCYSADSAHIDLCYSAIYISLSQVHCHFHCCHITVDNIVTAISMLLLLHTVIAITLAVLTLSSL